ncbi:ABC transporter substrate-binding protein [Anditalea andensis]|uniref:Iron ABC transporter n=1 Tax=Anditalea andensis TaxID=1048983 RepID=A0A074LM89_9BACT|nr:helical backbone metal receptor [Anditalea andensis]KEO74997.1 iron ABC transporter [Anditalea andensis]
MEYIDQLNRTVYLEDTPKRIISLVPSQTELLVDMGLGDQIVGVTKFCVHPKGFKDTKTIVGGTKNFRFDVIDRLAPDLIIGNKEENYKEGIEQLAEKYPVWVSDIFTVQDALDMMTSLGIITEKEVEAERITNWISVNFRRDFIYKGTAIYFIWQDPITVVGTNTFIDHLLEKAGFTNLIDRERYPQYSIEELQQLNPENVLLSSEPFPYREKHIENFKRLFPYAEVKLVDGEIFSWYGSRLIKAADYFETL